MLRLACAQASLSMRSPHMFCGWLSELRDVYTVVPVIAYLATYLLQYQKRTRADLAEFDSETGQMEVYMQIFLRKWQHISHTERKI